MFSTIAGLITLVAATAATVFGFVQARGFTRRKLAFVDSAQNFVAPVLAGLGAAILASIAVIFLPFVGGGTAVLFGAGVGAGVLAGQQDIKRRRLNP